MNNLQTIRGLLTESAAQRAVINDYVREFVAENGVRESRHGLCFEFASEFLEEHPDAEHWETLDMYDDRYKSYPLVLDYQTVRNILKENNARTLDEVGWTGDHAVVKWGEYVFDAAGISTFEDIAKYFESSDNTHWVRTQ